MGTGERREDPEDRREVLGEELGEDRCYDSFLFIRHSSLDSLPYLRTVLPNALRLNTASLLHAVHGSLVPFPPSLYGRPFLTRVYLNAVSSLLSHCPSIPLISTLALTLRTLLGPCAGSPHI